jgi:2-(1,2-epoxy-1,2-dihydrophenyl)acetyl-CoA isomerase
MPDTLLMAIEDHVARLTLNRPEAYNAMDADVLYGLARNLTALAADASVRGVVITGAGKAFCSGADLKSVIQDPTKASEILYTLAPVLHQSILEIRRMKKPVVAAINGVAAGAGMSLALACDFRVMAKSAVFRQAYTSWGLCIDGGGTFMLPRLVGLARAMEIAVFDPPITSDMALQWGLVTKVVDDGQAFEAALAMAIELADRSMHSYGWVKQLLTDSFTTPFEVQLERERIGVTTCGGHPDGLEGMMSFAFKRKPAFNKDATG